MKSVLHPLCFMLFFFHPLPARPTSAQEMYHAPGCLGPLRDVLRPATGRHKRLHLLKEVIHIVCITIHGLVRRRFL